MIRENTPSLIDNSTFNYMYDNLLSCHTKSIEYYSKYLNYIVFFLFVIITSFILYSCFTYKKTPEEMQIQIVKDQKYILDKIKDLEIRNKMQNDFITKLPIN